MKRPVLLLRALLVLAGIALLVCPCPATATTKQSPLPAEAGEQKLHVLCTTFPIYQITRNLTQGRDQVQVGLMIPAQLGCPHDYALTPQDMRRLARADLLVVNGLGLEEFLGAPLKQANPNLTVIDSSQGVSELLPYTAGKDEESLGHDDHQGVNPHLFVSPRLVAKITLTIARELARVDPAGEELYRQNGETYAQRMERLSAEVVAVGQRLKNKRIITQHGVFDYLARDLGVEVVAVVQAHAGQEPSAAEMIAIIKTAKEKKAGAIFSEPQYPARVPMTIAKEAGIKAATLDPVASGSEDAPLAYYETVMQENLKTLQTTLGVE